MARPLRILVAHNVPSRPTGGMNRIMGLIHDRLVQNGHCVDYFCTDHLPPGIDGRKGRLLFPLFLRRYAVAAARAGTPYDLINVHEPSGAAISVFKAAAGFPAIVVTSHGLEQRGWELALDELRRGREGPNLKSRLVYPTVFLPQARWSLRRADHIFCLNEEDRSYLISTLRRAEDSVTRIFPGADPVYGLIACERGYSNAQQLVFAGTWLKRKGIEDLVPAFCQLAEKYRELELVVLDAATSESAVWAYFPEALHGRIFLKQATTEAENAAILAEADIYLLPSLFEGTPLTLIEAMMSGMPVVTTAVCGMKDVIRDGVNGLLVPVRSPEAIVTAVERLLDSPELRCRLGHAAHAEAVTKYSWDRVAMPVETVYQRLCARRIQ